jgi:hypothetical protein
LHSTKRCDWKKKGWEPLTSKNNSILDSVENEENGYPVPNLNKTIINVTKEPSDTHIKTVQEKILEDITEKFMEKILDMVNQNV